MNNWNTFDSAMSAAIDSSDLSESEVIAFNFDFHFHFNLSKDLVRYRNRDSQLPAKVPGLCATIVQEKIEVQPQGYNSKDAVFYPGLDFSIGA
jgi:hypothetical protein